MELGMQKTQSLGTCFSLYEKRFQYLKYPGLPRSILYSNNMEQLTFLSFHFKKDSNVTFVVPPPRAAL